MTKNAASEAMSGLTDDERDRLLLLLAAVGSRTLLNVLLDMDRRNADGTMIIEVLMERIDGCQAPVMPK